MANKLSRAIGNLKTALDALVASGDLVAVKRTVINPLMTMQLPVAGLTFGPYTRQGSVWAADLVIEVVTRSGDSPDDEANIDLVAKIDAAIEALVAAGTAQAAIDSPTWRPWAWRPREDGPYFPIGNVGQFRIRVEGPILL